MNCLEARRLTLIDPGDSNAARLAHLEDCDACTEFARQAQGHEEIIREALGVSPPVGLAARILSNRSFKKPLYRPSRWAWAGLAATILMALVFAPAMLTSVFYEPFERELIAHVNAHDVLATANQTQIVELQNLIQVLARIGAEIPEDTGNIIYASNCVVDGVVMAHLLVSNQKQEYVVFLIPQRSVNERSFQQAGWAGQLRQAKSITIAVLNHAGTDLNTATDAFSEQFRQSGSLVRTI